MKIPAPKKLHLDRRADALAEQGGSDDDMLSTRELALWFGVSEQWLEIGRVKGYGPPFVKLGAKRVRYYRAQVKDWLHARTQASTGEYAR